MRSFSIWPYDEFPRTEGTGKLKRLDIAKGTPPPASSALTDLDVPLENLTSLERVERMVALGLDEAELSAPAKPPRPNRRLPISRPGIEERSPAPPAASFFRASCCRSIESSLTSASAALEHLENLQPPVIFAANHQSYMDVPAILSALPRRWRYRVAPAMRKEFFDEHFHGRSFTNSLNYYLSALFFNAFPIPQREAGTLATLRYIGELSNDRWCLLIFPEGVMTDAGEIKPFQPGVGMIAAKLGIPVVPVRIQGMDHVLHKSWRMARPGRVHITFGPALQLKGSDYHALAKQVEDAVRNL